jgi:hypothetical protein
MQPLSARAFRFPARCSVAMTLTAALVLATMSPVACSAEQPSDDVKVVVTRKGDVVSVQAALSVPVGAAQAFAVLTDYDHMREFLPDVVESKVVQRSANRLVVSQSGHMKLGVFSMPFDSVRQVELTPPHTLVSHAISGSVSRATVTTTLKEASGKTLITYESEAALNRWIPAGIGNGIVAAHVRQQLVAMRAEMVRRQFTSPAAAPDRP